MRTVLTLPAVDGGGSITGVAVEDALTGEG
jgi:hypothetical protein